MSKYQKKWQFFCVSVSIFSPLFSVVDHPESPHKKAMQIIETLEKENEIESAITILDLIVSEQPHAATYQKLSQLLKKKKRYQEAVSYLEKAAELEPDNDDIRMAMIEIRNVEQKHDAVEELLFTFQPQTQLMQIKKQFQTAALFGARNKYESAASIYEDLLNTMPNNKAVLLHYAYTLRCLERVDEAHHYFKRVLAIDQNHEVALFSASLAELSAGNYKDGFKGYELRRKYLKTAAENKYTQQPLWDGKSSLVGKKILVYAEQGLGDTIQFVRFLECLKKEGAYVIFAVQPRLCTFIKTAYPHIDQLITLKDDAPEHDYYAPLMSLPALFDISVGTIPSTIPYLFPDQALQKKWKQVLEKDQNIKIGICYQAGDINLNLFSGPVTTSNRSVPAELLLKMLSEIKGISLYSLQKIHNKDVQNQYQNLIMFDDFDKNAGAFMDTAALIPNLDLVISVDTSIAHVAGALGAKTFILLAKPADWRWMCHRNDSPWYKGVTLFRQTKPDQWEDVLEKLRAAVEKLVRQKSDQAS